MKFAAYKYFCIPGDVYSPPWSSHEKAVNATLSGLAQNTNRITPVKSESDDWPVGLLSEADYDPWRGRIESDLSTGICTEPSTTRLYVIDLVGACGVERQASACLSWRHWEVTSRPGTKTKSTTFLYSLPTGNTIYHTLL